MKTSVIIMFITVVVGLASEGALCFSVNEMDRGLLSEFMRLYSISNEDTARKILERRLLFFKEYTKKYLTEKEKKVATLLLVDHFSKQYIKKVLKENMPTDKEAYSFYLLHKDEYPNGFEKSKKIIKKKMVILKSTELIEKEYNRLKNDNK